MKVTTAPLSFLSYYVWETEKQIPAVHRVSTDKELIRVLGLGTMFAPALTVVEYKGKPPPNLSVSVFNKVYLSVEEKEICTWKSIAEQKEWLSILDIHPELFKKRISQFAKFFDFEAYDYIWDTYKYYPKKLLSEIVVLVLKYGNRNCKFTLEDVVTNLSKETVNLAELCFNLGKPSNNLAIHNLSETTLRQLFIGSDKKPPYIYYYLVGSARREGNYPELWEAVVILKEAVENSLIPLQTGAVLFNSWVSQLEKQKLNYKKFNYKVNSVNLNKLEQLIKGI
jgi:hypothetical protein